LARKIIRLVGFVQLGAFAMRSRKPIIVWMGVTDRHAGDSGIFGPPLAVRIVAQRAGDDSRLVSVTTTPAFLG
jgi:hypothetical protein